MIGCFQIMTSFVALKYLNKKEIHEKKSSFKGFENAMEYRALGASALYSMMFSKNWHFRGFQRYFC